MTRNVMKFERTPQAEEQARRWIVRIDAGPLGAEERQQLQQWLAEDANHPRLLDEHALLWATASRALFPAVTPAVAPAETPATAPSFVSPRPRWAWGLGAVGSAALATLLWLNSPWSPYEDPGRTLAAVYSTAVGEPRPIPLPDGSRTELNAASTLRVAFDPERRRVVLERGEGLFDVAKDPSRPFEVVAGGTVVRAVGTRFLVQRHADGSAEVTVYEGVVEVTRVSPSRAVAQPLRVGVGQMVVSADRRTLLAQAEPQAMGRKLAWQQGRIEFDRTPLADALEEVNRYSHVPIRLGDAALRDMPVSGSFSTQNTAVFLSSLEQGFGIRVERSGDSWLLTRADTR